MLKPDFRRIYTPPVSVGNVIIGGSTSIKVQSMTNTDTLNTKDCVTQIIKLINNGCELVRLTTRNIKEAENLENIRKELKKSGYTIPLIADIHFNPKVAEVAALYADKIRINPGNYADNKELKIADYSEAEYNNELNRIYERIKPLISICKQHDTAIRIGVNHGSLSSRIIARYGDTPEGMVEAALEFSRIITSLGFEKIVYSMKSSNTKIMVMATRLLAKKMIEEDLCFPIHLGVTEAGAGEDGRIRSAIGIGTLITEGIGDTIRVSLTEPPEYEIPVAKSIIYYAINSCKKALNDNQNLKNDFNLSHYKRITHNILNIGSAYPPVVIVNCLSDSLIDNVELEKLGYILNDVTNKWAKTDLSPDFIFVDNKNIPLNCEELAIEYCNTLKSSQKWESKLVYCANLNDLSLPISYYKLILLEIQSSVIDNLLIERIKQTDNIVIVLNNKFFPSIQAQKDFINTLDQNFVKCPVLLHHQYDEIDTFENLQIKASIDFGALLTDGLLNGIMITSKNFNNTALVRLCFSILQAAKARITKTEYISCPTCGRTQFNIMEVLEKVKQRTSHLRGLKIAVMGCIVNGPGEMADADYGYVGSGPGKVNLYKGKELILKSINEGDAIEALIAIIKENGHWQEPKH